MQETTDINVLKGVLNKFKKEGKILLAYLYGSYATGTEHKMSDIDLAVYLNTADERDTTDIIDAILMATEVPIEILRLDDAEESPFIIQEALRGIPLIEPDMETLYRVADRALHEAEDIRYRRAIASVQL